MKPFDNVAVSATKPRSKVWIKHKYVKYNGAWQNITYGGNGEVQSNSKRLTTDKIKLEKGNYKLDNLNNSEISPVAIAKFNDESFVELKANIKFPYELVVDDTFNQISLVFKKTNDGVITSGDVKNFEILSYENDILVKDDGVYNSILNYTENWKDLFNGFKYRKVNKSVEVLFNSKEQYALNSNEWKTLATLPIGYRPKANLYVSILILENNIFIPAMLAIDATGAVSIKQANGKTVNTNEIRGFSSYSIL